MQMNERGYVLRPLYVQNEPLGQVWTMASFQPLQLYKDACHVMLCLFDWSFQIT